MLIIADYERRFHPPPSRTCRYHVLYTGTDLSLLKSLQDNFADSRIVRSPGGSVTRILIASILYSLLLFDEDLPDATGKELEAQARALPHHTRTPIITLRAGEREAKIVETVARLLRQRSPPPAATRRRRP
jgi:DNA-binding response OmpR family regulator